MESTKNIWIVDDDKSIRWVLEKALSKQGMSPRCFEDPTQVLAQLENDHPDVNKNKVINNNKCRMISA